MKHDDQINDERIRELAVRQLVDYDKCQPGTVFAEGLELGIAAAYRLQSAVIQLRAERGERTVGHKVGCTSPTIRQQLGIDHCIRGRLWDTECHPRNSRLSRRRFANLAIEGELAVELSRVPTLDDLGTDGIPNCVARVFPVIELHNHVVRGTVPSAGELIANNAIHAGFVSGAGTLLEDVRDQDAEVSLQIFTDDDLIESCEGPALVQTVRSSLEWLVKHAEQAGEQLSAGQIVLTGSIPKLIPVKENCRIKVVTEPFGSVDVEFFD